MASVTPTWSSQFIGKTISPNAADIGGSNGVAISSSRGAYTIAFKSVSSCELHPADIELKVMTKDRVIKRVTSSVYVVYYNPPTVKRMEVKEQLKAKDKAIAKTVIRNMTK